MRDLHVVSLVVLAALMHATWNAVVKGVRDSVLTFAVVMGVGALAAASMLPFVPAPAPASWGFLCVSLGLHLGYFFFLLRAYRVGELSHVYPVARGAAPLLAAAGAVVFAREPLSASGLVGLLLVSVGVASFALEGAWTPHGSLEPFAFGFATAACIGAYTVTDGLGARLSGSQLGFIGWLLFLDGFPLTLYVLCTRRAQIRPYLRAHWQAGVAGGVLCATAYGLVIWALSVAPIAYVSALRETSVIFAALIGSVALGESFGRRRVLAAALVALGTAVMNLSR